MVSGAALVKFYLGCIMAAMLVTGAYWLYRQGYDRAELQNMAASAEALRAETAEQARIAEQQGRLRLKAEVRATQIEERSKVALTAARAAADAARQKEDPGCPARCFSVDWRPSQ